MAETDPKTMQDLTSVVRNICAGLRPRHPGAAPARPADPAAFSTDALNTVLEAVFLEASPSEASGHLDSPGRLHVRTLFTPPPVSELHPLGDPLVPASFQAHTP